MVVNVIFIFIENRLEGNILIVSSSCFWMFGSMSDFRDKIKWKREKNNEYILFL